MSQFTFTPEFLYDKTNKGLDIIFLYLPQAHGCERNNKMFKFREDETTPSATIYENENNYFVKDFGGSNYSPIDLHIYFTGDSFLQALKFLYGHFGLCAKTNSNTTFATTTKAVGIFEVIEAKKFTNIDTIGRFVTPNIATEYDLIPVESYSFVFMHKETKLPTMATVTATENYPIFAYKYSNEWCKIYQPFGGSYKHSFLGKKPQRHVYGLTRLKTIFNNELKQIDKKISDAQNLKDEALVSVYQSEKANFKLENVYICSGGSDGLNVASLGYNAIWYNSEGEQMNYEEWKLLNKYCKNVYNLPDIDKPGIKYAYNLAEKFWNLKTIYLPESLKQNNGKDLRDWLKKYSKFDYNMIKYQFDCLTSGALQLKFFTKIVTRSSEKYILKYEFLSYFLNVKGFYTFQVEQNHIENTSPETIIFIQIIGNAVKIVSPRIIREFCKQYLIEKGQPIEVREVVALSQMFSENQLLGLKQIDLNFKNYSFDKQYFFFENNVAEISENQIKLMPQGEFKNFVWQKSVKNHHIYKEMPFFDISIMADGKPKIDILRQDCEYFNYLANTSRVYWKKELEEQFGENETAKNDYHKNNRFNLAGSYLTDDEKSIQNQHLCNKIYAIGYLLHRYKKSSFAKMVIATDDEPKELEDEANGGSGKSLLFKGLNFLLKRHYLNGKNEQFKSDKHILDGFTKEKDYLIIEDAHPNFDIEYIFEWITGSIAVNPKNRSPYEVAAEDAGKLAYTTNYGLKTLKDSILRRLLFITTSSYYHFGSDRYKEERKVSDDFDGKDLFENWTNEQWNRHYFFLMECCKTYLKYKDTEFKAPIKNILINNQNAFLGDVFTTWADAYFTDDFIDNDGTTVDGNLNKLISRTAMYADYCKAAGKYPKLAAKWKKAVKMYVEQPSKGWVFNPPEVQNKDGLIKRRGIKEHGEPTQVECFYIKTTTNENNEPQQETIAASDDLPF